MAQTKITDKSLGVGAVQENNIADGALVDRHFSASTFSPALFSNKTNNSTGYLGVPVGTVAQRILAQTGGMRFNSDFGYHEWYDVGTGAWLRIGDAQPAIATSTNSSVTDITDPIDGQRYRVHTFTSLNASSFIVSRKGAVEFLIVAGGGSGGCDNGTNNNGGGGGGGILYKKEHNLNVGSYPVVVGIGAQAIGEDVVSIGNNGGNSSFANFIALGGGGGGGVPATNYNNGNINGMNGGSGGGAGSTTGGGGVSLQVDLSGAKAYGNDGGVLARSYTGGGGGGAGSTGRTAGGDKEPTGFGDGGRGLPSYITGTLIYYAGGGGGSANSSEHAGMGWHGGGRGFGTTDYYSYLEYPTVINPITLGFGTPDAIDGTGGGGGGGTYWSNNGAHTWKNRGSGKGGSGIVIVRYRIA